METPQKKNEPNMYHSKKQSQHESMKLAPIFEGAKNGVHQQRYQSLDGSQHYLEVNKQEFASQSNNDPSFKGELVNIDIPKIVDKNKNTLNQSRSNNDMHLMATASLNAKTTTASDLTSNILIQNMLLEL